MIDLLIFSCSALLAILDCKRKTRINASQLGPQFFLDHHARIPLCTPQNLQLPQLILGINAIFVSKLIKFFIIFVKVYVLAFDFL